MILQEFKIDPMGAVRMNQSRASQHTPAAERYGVYKQQLRLMARMAKYEVPAVLSLRFVVAMPASWSGRKRVVMNGQPHQSRPDLDNLVKAFKDALCADDAFVWRYGEMEKVWGEVGVIEVLETAGVPA